MEKVPDECSILICTYLSEYDVLSIASTSKNHPLSLVARSDNVWERIYKKTEQQIRSELKKVFQRTESVRTGSYKCNIGPYGYDVKEYKYINHDLKIKSVPSLSPNSWKKIKRPSSFFEKYVMLRYETWNQDGKKRKEIMDLSSIRNFDFSDFDNKSFDSKIPLKCVVVGDGKVGKTCLTITLYSNSFPHEYVPTVFDNFTLERQYGPVMVDLNIWDGGGNQDFHHSEEKAHWNSVFSKSDVCILCFSIDDPQSLENIMTKWHPKSQEYRKGIPVILCGTKMDLRDDEETIKELKKRDLKPCSRGEGADVAWEIGAVKYVEVSSKEDINVTKDDIMLKLLSITALQKPDDSKKSKDKCLVM